MGIMKAGFILENKSLLYGMLGLLAIAIPVVFLWEGHKSHILGVAPYLIFLLCPLLHLFMHRRHGGH